MCTPWAHTAECTQAIVPLIFNFSTGEGVNFQLHATAALLPGKKIFPCQLDRMLGGPFPGIEARFLGLPVP